MGRGNLNLGSSSQGENFSRHWVRGRGRAILTPRPFIQVHHGLVPHRPPQGAAGGFGWVTRGPGLDHLRPHLPGPQGVGRASRGLGVNLQRPHLAGPQHYQPPPLCQTTRKRPQMPHQNMMQGKALPNRLIPTVNT